MTITLPEVVVAACNTAAGMAYATDPGIDDIAPQATSVAMDDEETFDHQPYGRYI